MCCDFISFFFFLNFLLKKKKKKEVPKSLNNIKNVEERNLDLGMWTAEVD
jgi:hypothetical protein